MATHDSTSLLNKIKTCQSSGKMHVLIALNKNMIATFGNKKIAYKKEKKKKRTQSRDTDGVIIREKGIQSLQKHVDVFIYTILPGLRMSRSLYPSRSPVSYAPSTVP